MDSSDLTRHRFSRRGFLNATLGMASAAAGTLFLNGHTKGADKQPSQKLHTYNGGTEPYPIPWLDKNGSHNQPAGPALEPSHIYHFNGRVARCANFAGMGTDNKGNRIAFGTPTTDFGFVQGEYFAGRQAQTGEFTHI
jgi:hypothetical protein